MAFVSATIILGLAGFTWYIFMVMTAIGGYVCGDSCNRLFTLNELLIIPIIGVIMAIITFVSVFMVLRPRRK